MKELFAQHFLPGRTIKCSDPTRPVLSTSRRTNTPHCVIKQIPGGPNTKHHYARRTHRCTRVRNMSCPHEPNLRLLDRIIQVGDSIIAQERWRSLLCCSPCNGRADCRCLFRAGCKRGCCGECCECSPYSSNETSAVRWQYRIVGGYIRETSAKKRRGGESTLVPSYSSECSTHWVIHLYFSKLPW